MSQIWQGCQSNRVDIPASTQARSQPTRIFHSKGRYNVKVFVLDPVTVLVSGNQQELIPTDGVGNPQRGAPLALGPSVVDFLAFSGELWASCQVQTQVEIMFWPVL
jgi:hypothetical protein